MRLGASGKRQPGGNGGFASAVALTLLLSGCAESTSTAEACQTLRDVDGVVGHVIREASAALEGGRSDPEHVRQVREGGQDLMALNVDGDLREPVHEYAAALESVAVALEEISLSNPPRVEDFDELDAAMRTSSVAAADALRHC